MNEFEAIRAFFDWPTTHTELGVGDDAALCAVPDGQLLAISSDMLVAGRHFFADVDPESLGHKALAVNLSDMAAMGATPRQFTLALALPTMDTDWLTRFAKGLRRTASTFQCDLVGGDTTAGPLNISITIMGEVAKGQALKRSGAKVGDDLYVTGALGAARLGLWYRTQRLKHALPQASAAAAIQAMDWPVPRVALGLALRGVASAAMDLSDGLAGDVRHMAKASRCHAEVHLSDVPVAPCVLQAQGINPALFATQGGDDYELLFAASPEQRDCIQTISTTLAIPITRIGTMRAAVAGADVSFVSPDGRDISDALQGFDHFASDPVQQASAP